MLLTEADQRAIDEYVETMGERWKHQVKSRATVIARRDGMSPLGAVIIAHGEVAEKWETTGIRFLSEMPSDALTKERPFRVHTTHRYGSPHGPPRI